MRGAVAVARLDCAGSVGIKRKYGPQNLFRVKFR